MPEGHTVHRLAGAFAARFVGKTVQASSPQGRFADGAALLDGRVLRATEAHGKQMFLMFSGEHWLRVHLGLYGMWRFAGPGLAGFGRRVSRLAAREEVLFPPEPRGLVRLRLLTQSNVADLSGPTACVVLSSAEKAVAMQRLGEDPLRDDADPRRAFTKVHASRSAVGLLLMRQDIVAGIGNIYRAEVLFRARLDPHRPGREISAAVWDALWTDLAALLQDGVETGRIVTTEPEHRGRASGKIRRQDASYVAHRAGRPCRVCGTPVLAEPMAGRTLYWCPMCQTG
ncbi:Fpg/Nei family DNA glycosylase [Lichenicoccus sp.]|uniref:Fpg/Nei family DNA glycosylase n=1 Tax=Lichenicoccus sp. TaxID=2781899 RepID=UPI003D144D77